MRDWSVSDLWNKSLLVREERPLEKRDRIYASELGGSMIDRFLKMNAVPYTNPANERAMRKFQAGNLWEAIVELVLTRAGVIVAKQEKITYKYEGLLEVSGRQDFVAGGVPDWARARAEMAKFDSLFPSEFMRTMTEEIISGLEKAYGNDELKTKVLEIKSVSAFVFSGIEKSKTAKPQHVLQCFHYLKGLGLDEGSVVYICRDDCMILEAPVYNPSAVEQYYKKDIELISGYVMNGQRPPLEEQVVFDFDTGKFQTNKGVEYSPYLTVLYGYNEPREYSDRWKGKVSSMNRVMKRIVDGAKMTAKNLEVIEEAKKTFPRWDEYVQVCKDLKDKGVLVEDEEAED